MNYVFYIDFAIFSIFATLILTEIMGSILLLLLWNDSKKVVLEYVVPIWEITGTFAVFWVVLSDFAFPSILIPLASIFSAGLLIFLILFVARNASISFAEFFEKKGWLDEKKLYYGYALSSILLGLVVLVIVSTIIGGYGLNLSNYTFNFFSFASNISPWLFILGSLVTAIGFAPIFYNIDKMKKMSMIFVFIGVLISMAFIFIQEKGIPREVLIPLVLTIALPILYNIPQTRNVASNKAFFIAYLSITLFSLNFLVYPTAFGKLSVDSLTTNGTMANAYIIMTLTGLVLLAILLALYTSAVKKSASVLNKIQE